MVFKKIYIIKIYNKIIMLLDYMINKLIFLSKKSNVTHKHSAVIFSNRRNKFFGINTAYGYNHKYNEIISDHAEVSAIYSAMKKINRKNRTRNNKSGMSFRNMNLFVIRYSNGSGLMMSKPCEKCQKFISKFRFKHIYYSDENGNIAKYY